MSNSTGYPQPRTVNQVMAEQYPIPGGWICPDCRHHAGGLNCSLGVFISFTGANMSNCWGFRLERRKRTEER